MEIEQPIDIIDNNKRKASQMCNGDNGMDLNNSIKKVKSTNIIAAHLVDESTGKIFLHPVLLPNGKIYEKDVLIRILDESRGEINGKSYSETDFIVCSVIEEM